jgi:hypothetical protein
MDGDESMDAADAAAIESINKANQDPPATDHGPTVGAPADKAGKTQAAPANGGEGGEAGGGEPPTLEEFLKSEARGGEKAPETGKEPPAEVKEWVARLSRQATELDKRMKDLDTLEARLKSREKGEKTEESEDEGEVDLEDLSPFERRVWKESQRLRQQLEGVLGQDQKSKQEQERQALEARFDAELASSAKKYGLRHPEVLEGFLSRAPQGTTIEQVAKYLSKHMPWLCALKKDSGGQKSSILGRGGEGSKGAAGPVKLSDVASDDSDAAVLEILSKHAG